MRDRTFGARTGLRAALYTELTAVLGTAISAATAGPWWAGAAGGAAVGLLLFVVRVKRLTPWQWVRRAVGRLRHKQHRVDAAEFVDVDSDGQPLGVRVDEHTRRHAVVGPALTQPEALHLTHRGAHVTSRLQRCPVEAITA